MKPASPQMNENSNKRQRHASQVSDRRLPVERQKASSRIIEENENVWHEQWCDMFNLLKRYQKEKMHVSPARDEDFDGKLLGKWAANQRFYFEQLSLVGFDLCDPGMTSRMVNGKGADQIGFLSHGKSATQGSKGDSTGKNSNQQAVRDVEVQNEISNNGTFVRNLQHRHSLRVEALLGEILGLEDQVIKLNQSTQGRDKKRPAVTGLEAQNQVTDQHNLVVKRLKHQHLLSTKALEDENRVIKAQVVKLIQASQKKESIQTAAPDAEAQNEIVKNSIFVKKLQHQHSVNLEVLQDKIQNLVCKVYSLEQAVAKGDKQILKMDKKMASRHQDEKSTVNAGFNVTDTPSYKNGFKKADSSPNKDGGDQFFGYIQSWDSMYQLLKDYCTENYHACPSPGELYKGQNLGDWVFAQRENQHKSFELRLEGKADASSMTDQQVTLLNEVGFVWNEKEASWFDMYRLLKEYRTEHEHVCPSKNRDPYKGENLGRWVVTQRESYKVRQQGKNIVSSYRMTDQRIAFLNEIGFAWDTKTVSRPAKSRVEGSQWYSMYQLLNEYRTEHNHVNTNKKLKYKGRNLGYWVADQRKNYQKGLSVESIKMSDERIALLEEIGFFWKLRSEPEASVREGCTWHSKYLLLKDYLEVHKNTWPSGNQVYKDENLGNWVGSQRAFYRRRQNNQLDSSSPGMSDERIALLNEIGIIWERKSTFC